MHLGLQSITFTIISNSATYDVLFCQIDGSFSRKIGNMLNLSCNFLVSLKMKFIIPIFVQSTIFFGVIAIFLCAFPVWVLCKASDICFIVLVSTCTTSIVKRIEITKGLDKTFVNQKDKYNCYQMEKKRNGIKTSKVSAFESTRKMQEKNLLRIS